MSKLLRVCVLVCVCPRVCFNPVFFSSVVWKGELNIEQPVDCERWSIIQRLDLPLCQSIDRYTAMNSNVLKCNFISQCKTVLQNCFDKTPESSDQSQQKNVSVTAPDPI